MEITQSNVMAAIVAITYLVGYLLEPEIWHPFQLAVIPMLIAIFLKIDEVKNEVKRKGENG